MILGVYSDLKIIKTRSVVQIVVEVPLERGKEVTDLFGLPQPNAEIPVVVARMDPNKLNEQSNVVQLEDHRPVDDEDEPHKPPRPLSQIAAFLCTVEAFKRFIFDKVHGFDHMPSTDEATEWLRSACQVRSRRELDTNEAAARRFKEIRAGYNLWLKDVA